MLFTTPKELINLLGSFWRKVSKQVMLTERLIGGVLAKHEQSTIRANELLEAASNLEISAGQTFSYEKFTFNSKSFAGFSYGNSEAGFYDLTGNYGEYINNDPIYKIPGNIISIPTLYDSPVSPTAMYTENVDYVLKKGQLKFRANLTIPEVMYARRVVKDTGFVYRHLGYIIKTNLSDTIFRKVPIKELWRLFSYGPNYYNTLRVLALCAESPVSKHYEEIVEGVSDIREGSLVITDKEVYFAKIPQTISVEPGQVLKQGTPLFSGLAILHDRSPYVFSSNLPADMKGYDFIQYGAKKINPSRAIFIKADIQGEQSVAIQYLKNVLPLDTKVIVLANKNLPEARADEFEVTNSVAALSKAIPDYNAADLEITLKSNSSLKYSFYGI